MVQTKFVGFREIYLMVTLNLTLRSTLGITQGQSTVLQISCASWLSAYHHELRWEDRMVPYNEEKRLIMAAVFEDDAIVHGSNKRIYTPKIDRAKGIPSLVVKSAKSITIEGKSEILRMFWGKSIKVANVLNVINANEI
ncbi:hypothetical protein G5I_05111 [Acromyrmex echinatior]|uniref:Uncharacterized protein n=1 Tax=Acromyrmex echinatior TaxID=103372 RepID=F4WHF0_ACREC|nr:hypothetical protein G5I_05111 [Acromyrmex echinatior]